MSFIPGHGMSWDDEEREAHLNEIENMATALVDLINYM